ncbi:hypothetical protein IU427_17335 [Nocardia beijingensis]|uniref:hypothetical protein n=1 Tax=Nocardia beijingensis TaxID=95162 RepID=UPI0018954193|nr:hypothetical protein [Nocardia beijingensis]MBF6466930.1 hypothetical protein [Nocardia beijingensis]
MQPADEPHLSMQGLNSPLPDEPDVHLMVRMRGHTQHYAACLTAVLVFLQEESIRRRTDAVAVASGATDQLPRLPCARLYVER